MNRPASEYACKARLILLGASNLTRAFSTVIETSRQVLGSPLEILAALGHGRSFGMRSSIGFGWRGLPGILDSGIWRAIGLPAAADQRSQAQSSNSIPTFALITDIGNDIMYGASPLTIAGWVEQCIERLQERGACVGLTTLPMVSIRNVRVWQYWIVKSVLFPTRRLSFTQAIERASELHDLIVDLAQRRSVTLIETSAEWYGFDPIHIRRRKWASAWRTILSACVRSAPSLDSRAAQRSIRRWLQLRTAAPELRWIVGLRQTCRQPARVLSDGSSISLF